MEFFFLLFLLWRLDGPTYARDKRLFTEGGKVVTIQDPCS